MTVVPFELHLFFTKYHTLDNRFQVNRQSIGSSSNRMPIVTCDRYRLALFEAHYGRQQVSIDTSLICCSASIAFTCDIKTYR